MDNLWTISICPRIQDEWYLLAPLVMSPIVFRFNTLYWCLSPRLRSSVQSLSSGKHHSNTDIYQVVSSLLSVALQQVTSYYIVTSGLVVMKNLINTYSLYIYYLLKIVYFYSQHLPHNKAITSGPLGTFSIHQNIQIEIHHHTTPHHTTSVLIPRNFREDELKTEQSRNIYFHLVFDKYTPGQIFYHILRLEIILVRKNIFLKYSGKSDKSSGRN